MKPLCKSLNRSNNNIAIWVAIFTSLLFSTHNNPGPHHHPIAAFAVILAAGVIAWVYTRKCKAA